MSGCTKTNRQTPLQAGITEVKVIMGQNIRGVLERGDNLEALEIKAERLQLLTGEFKKVCVGCRSRVWCQRNRSLIIIVLVSALLICIITLAVVLVLILS